ncbi:glycosyltransferase [Priestia megaterium]|uniref:glycosyltransferase n=1 Tax=Priestia megaterium TaxID=1404 RepID=UPI002DB9F1DE|nr:glycosyltransferase [Priestia megaterium]MEC1072263.1 glycosyltransferase [Priestia megaterium]
MNIKLSIIVPVYNLEKFVGRCLESILCQVNDEVEIIIIDDGSTDNSGTIIDEYAQKHSNIRVTHKSNEGISKTRNKGLVQAKGEYVLFVDSDDYIAGNMVKTMLNQAINKNADIVISKAVNEWSDQTKEDMFTKDFDESEVINGMEAVKRFWAGEINGHPWNKLIRRELMVNNNIVFPEDKKIYEDAPTLFKLYLKANRIAFVNQNLYYYVQHPGSVTKKPKFSMLYDHVDMIRAIEGSVDKRYCKKDFKKEYQYFLLKQMYYHIDLLNQLYFSNKLAAEQHKKELEKYIKLIEFSNLFNNYYFNNNADKLRLFLVKTRLCYLLRFRYKS